MISELLESVKWKTTTRVHSSSRGNIAGLSFTCSRWAPSSLAKLSIDDIGTRLPHESPSPTKEKEKVQTIKLKTNFCNDMSYCYQLQYQKMKPFFFAYHKNNLSFVSILLALQKQKYQQQKLKTHLAKQYCFQLQQQNIKPFCCIS